VAYDSSFDLAVIPSSALASVSGGAAKNEWTEYSSSVQKELLPLLNNPKPEVRDAVCALVGLNGAAELQTAKGAARPGERAKVGAARALEEACRVNARLPSNALFQ
jgi:hypothetical protein